MEAMEAAVNAGSIKLWFNKRNSHARHCVSIIEHIFHHEDKDADGEVDLIKDKDFEADCIHLVPFEEKGTGGRKKAKVLQDLLKVAESGRRPSGAAS